MTIRRKPTLGKRQTETNTHAQTQDSSRVFMMHLVEILILKGVFWSGVRHRVYTMQKTQTESQNPDRKMKFTV